MLKETLSMCILNFPLIFNEFFAWIKIIMEILLTPDYCCGGGHCGPMPGYFYQCPHCNEETQARTGFELEVGEKLKCSLCKGSVTATQKLSNFKFEFSID